MQDLSFAQPLWIYLGIALAVGVLIAFRFLDSRNRRDLEKFASGRFLAGLRTGISKPRRIFKRTCYLLGIFFLFTALARPQSGFEWREVRRKGIDILFAIDSSRSMLAEDMSPNRLERVKLGMIDFVEKLDGDRIGLLPFSGSSFLLCPLTVDYQTFKSSLDAVDTEIIPHKGTDIASAIREAHSTFEEAGNNHRILVVLTDGEDLQGEALAAAKQANEDGMIIYTVGIGSPEGGLIPIGGSYLRDASGNPVKTKLDEAGLKAIAEATDGTYARFGQQGEGLQTIYQEKLALIPKEDLKQRMQKVAIEQYQWPLGAAILLFLLDFIVSDRRRIAKSDKQSPSLPGAAKAATILAAGLLTIPGTSRAESAPETYNTGISAFTDGEFEKAQQAFRDTLANTSDLKLQAQSYYNLGNTHFSIGAGKLEEEPKETIADWEKSLSAYEGSLKLNPDDADAEFNRDYVKKLLEELKKQEEQQEDKKDDQKKEENSEDQESEEDSKEEEQEKSEDGEQDENKPSDSEEEQEGDSEEDSQKGEEPGEEEKEGSEGEEDDKESGENQEGESGEESDEEKEGEQSQTGEEGEESSEEEGKPGEQSGEEGEEKEGDQTSADQARQAPGEMSPEEARELLKALQKDEKRVILIPQKENQRRSQNNKTKGKDW